MAALAEITDWPALLEQHEREFEADCTAPDPPPQARAREALACAHGAVAGLWRALDANATHGAWWCADAARGFRAAAEIAAEPQRTQLRVLADAAEGLADPWGPDDDAVYGVIEAAAETVAALDRQMRAVEAAEGGLA